MYKISNIIHILTYYYFTKLKRIKYGEHRCEKLVKWE